MSDQSADIAPSDDTIFIGSGALLTALYGTYEAHIGIAEPDGPDGPYMWCACGWRSDDLGPNSSPGASYAAHLTNAQHAAAVKALQPIVRRVSPADNAMVERAIHRIEESRKSHAEWAEHIPKCAHCIENGPPPFIQSQAQHEQIVAEYDEVLAVLRGHRIPHPATTSSAAYRASSTPASRTSSRRPTRPSDDRQ